MAIKKKCNIAKNKFCDTLEEIASDQYGSGRRIFITATMNWKTGDRGVGAAYQREAKKGYVWLNFCPWCGGDLSKRSTSKRKAKT